MTHSDDFIGRLEDYLDAFDGATPLPDRVRDAVRAELPTARQVRPRPGLERVFTMLSNASAGAKLGLVAAAVVVAALAGGVFLNNNPSIGTGPTPAPSAIATPAPSPTATPTATPPPVALNGQPYVICDSGDPGQNCLPQGTYQLTGGQSVWPVQVTLDLPTGWMEWNPGTGWDAVLANAGPDYGGTGWGLMFTTVSDVWRDPCTATGTIPAAQVTTPEQLAAAISAWPSFTATTPQPITVDGYSGVELVLYRSTKAPNACGSGQAWLSASHAIVDAYPMVYGPTYPTTVRIIDTGHGLLVTRATDFATSVAPDPGTTPEPSFHTNDLDNLHSIVNSIHLTAWPTN